jgi:hypothetical protein
VDTNFRATVSAVKVVRKGHSARMRVTCPATAPGCFVSLTGRVGARAAFKTHYLTLTPGAAQIVKVKVKAKAAKGLRKRSKLKISAMTAGSTLAPATARGKLKKQ